MPKKLREQLLVSFKAEDTTRNQRVTDNPSNFQSCWQFKNRKFPKCRLSYMVTHDETDFSFSYKADLFCLGQPNYIDDERHDTS